MEQHKHIQSVIEAALASGAEGVTYTLGDSVDHELIEVHPPLDRPAIGLYPLIPDTQVVPRVLNNGLVSTALEFTKGAPFSKKTRALFRGGLSYLTSNPFRALRSYFEIEVDRIDRRRPAWTTLRTLILHELATDALVGLQAVDAFGEYCDVFKSATELPPAFETRNFVSFLSMCREAKIDVQSIIAMTPCNALGFQMTPSATECENALRSAPEANVIAISLLAGGKSRIDDAIDYVESLPSVKSMAIGVSSIHHATETFMKLRAHWKTDS